MDYSINQFVSELGGAAGIVLGVSLFTVVKGIVLYIHVLYICYIVLDILNFKVIDESIGAMSNWCGSGVGYLP